MEAKCKFGPKTTRRRGHRYWEGHSLRVRHKQDWGQGFIVFLSQTAVLPESDAGSDVV